MSTDGRGGHELKYRLRTYLALLLSAALIIPSTPALGVTAAQKLDQARAVKSQVDALNDKASMAEENYMEASDAHDKLLAQTRAAAARVAKAEKRLNKLETHLNTRADDMYRNGPLDFLDVLLGARTFDQFATLWDTLKDLNVRDANYISQTKDARAEANAAHSDLAAKEQASAHQVAIMASNRKYAEGLLAQRKRELAGIEVQVAQLQAQEAAAELVRARSQARSEGHSGSTADYNGPAPTIPAHGDVVAFAKSRLGCPYVWGGGGPNTFDCSGLAMWCYEHVGISLPHSSREQINSGQRVSRANLEPGDLVFFGSPIHHVGIYVGGGEMIEAPYTGARVRYASAFRSDYAGACRPN